MVGTIWGFSRSFVVAYCMRSWTSVSFLLTKFNSIHELVDPIQSNPVWVFTTKIQFNSIHKHLV